MYFGITSVVNWHFLISAGFLSTYFIQALISSMVLEQTALLKPDFKYTLVIILLGND